jgi:hypothetical protein
MCLLIIHLFVGPNGKEGKKERKKERKKASKQASNTFVLLH